MAVLASGTLRLCPRQPRPRDPPGCQVGRGLRGAGGGACWGAGRPRGEPAAGAALRLGRALRLRGLSAAAATAAAAASSSFFSSLPFLSFFFFFLLPFLLLPLPRLPFCFFSRGR